MPTPKQALIELTYDGDLKADVAQMVAADMSWREIAERVNARSGDFTVSHESLRQWYGLADQAAS